jgi:hypothetical protein
MKDRAAMRLAASLAACLWLVVQASASASAQTTPGRCHWIGRARMWALTRQPSLTPTYAFVDRGGIRYCLNRAELEIGHGHQVADAAGSVVVLDDGSAWSVAPIDAATAGAWPRLDRITVTHSTNARYRYRLTDRDQGQAVIALFIGVY